MADSADWLPADTVWHGIERHDGRLRGVSIPLSEEDVRRIAARPLEPMSPGGYYGPGNGVRLLTNSLRLRCRRTAERIDAVSAWENEGGR